MNRNTLWYAFVALLGGVAVALAAVTVSRTPSPEGSSGTGRGEGSRELSPLRPPADGPASALDAPPFLADLVALLAVLIVLATVAYLFYNSREVLWRLLAVGAVAAVLFFLYQLLTLLSSNEGNPIDIEFGEGPTFGGGEGGAGGDQLVSTDPSSLPVILVLLVGLLLVGLALVISRDSSDGRNGSGPTDADPETTAAVGRAAGRAADRLETEATAENEIYRAWVEMTRLVDLSEPETKTTAEFSAAAVDAGMEPADVRELTQLFERVRYGTEEPSPDDEQRAIDLFRRIEARYAEDHP